MIQEACNDQHEDFFFFFAMAYLCTIVVNVDLFTIQKNYIC